MKPLKFNFGTKGGKEPVDSLPPLSSPAATPLVLAFAFAADEFLDEELFHIEKKYGKVALLDGKYVYNSKRSHPHEWWCTQAACDEFNKLKLLNLYGE